MKKNPLDKRWSRRMIFLVILSYGSRRRRILCRLSTTAFRALGSILEKLDGVYIASISFYLVKRRDYLPAGWNCKDSHAGHLFTVYRNLLPRKRIYSWEMRHFVVQLLRYGSQTGMSAVALAMFLSTWSISWGSPDLKFAAIRLFLRW